MAKLAKFLQGVAGAAGGAGLNVEEVFSTYLYTGTGSNRYVNNGLDLSTEGGMVWIKARSTIHNHVLYDTERLAYRKLSPNQTNAQSIDIGGLTEFTTNGFRVGTETEHNQNNTDFISWSWRKAEKFFDVVTYTGTGVNGRTVSHNLDTTPGMIIVKQTSASGEPWYVYHRSLGATKRIYLSSTGAAATSDDGFYNTEPTSTEFTVAYNGTNKSGATYVAYLFAHNDGDGDFGPTGDQDIIKCGSFTGAGYSESEQFNVNLGFEPQWIMYKRTDSSTGGGWFMVDNMRGWRPETSSNFEYLQAQSSDAEAQSGALGIRSDGFRVREGLGRQYIYIAIRRGPMAVPESATDVFAIDTASGTSPTPPLFTAGFPVDMYLYKRKDLSQSWRLFDRVRGDEVYLRPDNQEHDDVTGDDSGQHNDLMTGIGTATFTNSNLYQWMWRRAPGYFDVVAYSGGSGADTISHNLGVTPEMIWVKNRDSQTIAARGNWVVYHASVSSGYLNLHDTVALQTSDAASKFGNGSSLVAPTADDFTVADDYDTGRSGNNYIAYLFATVAGVSKVGSYTGNGSSTGDAQNIDCGFSSGARFVLIKATSAAYGWMLFDTERGITSGNDSLLLLNDTDAETTAFDSVDPYSSGFTAVQGPYNVNQSGVEYIFYAIA